MTERKRKNIEIKNLPIRLGQFLKYANLVDNGIEAKILIQQGSIRVNGEVEKRRGRKLQSGDHVSFMDIQLQVVAAD